LLISIVLTQASRNQRKILFTTDVHGSKTISKNFDFFICVHQCPSVVNKLYIQERDKRNAEIH
jgi:hypothetical protein